MEITLKRDVNYCAKVVQIDVFHKHSDPEVERLKCCTVDGFNIITGIDAEPGLYIYFPVMSQINPELLKYCNLFRHSELNENQEKSGMFDDSGRVRAIKLRGELSEGFILPAIDFENFCVSSVNSSPILKAGTEFDTVSHGIGKEFWVCRKYRIKQKTHGHYQKNRQRVLKLLDKVIPDQFRFHYDTVLIKKAPHVVQPNDLISITEKVHGTSGISAYVQCNRPLKWYEKLYKKLINRSYNPRVYDYLYASRTVVKNRYYNKSASSGYYGNDEFREIVDQALRPYLIKGMTLYYEILGYTKNGGYIQKDYDYGFMEPDNQYLLGIHFGVKIYRITLTNVDGNVHEFSAREVQQWCAKNDIPCVNQYYYGFAKDLYPELEITEDWSNQFLEKLADDKRFNMEMNSPTCNNKVPHEGVVIKVENSKSEAFKLKCFKFLNKEQQQLDKGESNIEDEA